LNVIDLEFGFAINGQNTGIVLLTTLLGVEVGLVEKDTEWGTGR